MGRRGHEITRRKILHDQAAITQLSFEQPELLKQELIGAVREYLGPDYDIEKHFTPRYRPWQQRIAFVPDGDIFKGIASGKATVVTDEIEHFTKKGILLKSGEELEADIIPIIAWAQSAKLIFEKPLKASNPIRYWVRFGPLRICRGRRPIQSTSVLSCSSASWWTLSRWRSAMKVRANQATKFAPKVTTSSSTRVLPPPHQISLRVPSRRIVPRM